MSRSLRSFLFMATSLMWCLLLAQSVADHLGAVSAQSPPGGFRPPALRRFLRNQVRRHKADKFTRRYDLGFLPESRKMPKIARDQVIGAGRIGTFQEPIVIWIARHFKTPRRYRAKRLRGADLLSDRHFPCDSRFSRPLMRQECVRHYDSTNLIVSEAPDAMSNAIPGRCEIRRLDCID